MSNFKLTDEQIAIIEPEEWTSAVITASAGSGKTTTIIRRAINQVETFVNDEPWKNIAIISFTNKSADDIKKKVQELNGHNHNIVTMTFHAFLIHHILSFTQLFRGEKNIKFNFNCKSSSLEEWCYLVEESNIITNSIDKDNDYLFEYALKTLKDNPYIQTYLKNKFNAIYIDEAQDNNALQYDIVNKLLELEIQIVMVGDPKQTIFRFRGADSSKFIALENNTFFKVHFLTKNFRCHEIINECANKNELPEKSKYDNHKNGVFVTTESKFQEKVITYFDKKDNEGLCFLFYGVKGNNNELNRKILEKYGLPLIVQPDVIAFSSSPFYLNQLFKMFFGGYKEELNYIENILHEIHPRKAKALLKNIKENPNHSTLIELNDYVGEYFENEFDKIISTFHSEEARQFYRIDTSSNFAMTIHSAKGLEFDNVVLMSHDFQDLNYRNSDTKNLFYVACTRAKKRLFFLKL